MALWTLAYSFPSLRQLVFAEVKTYLRNHTRPGWSLRDRTLEAAGSVTYKNLLAYYQHCTSVALRSWDDQ